MSKFSIKNKILNDLASGGPLMSDVAELAGVAVSTVSRALANPDRVNEKTRAKIAAAAKKLGYTPNAAARNLRVGKSNIIMIVLPGTLKYGASQIVPRVLESINQTLIQNGFNLMIANLDRSDVSEKHVLNLAFDGTVRAAISLSEKLPVANGRSLADTGLPVVSLLVDLSSDGIPSIVTNDREIMREAVANLIAEGHQQFLYIGGPSGNYHDLERYQGVVEALRVAGLNEENIKRCGGTRGYQEGFVIGREAVETFLSLKTKPTAVVATGDEMAISFIGEIKRQGWRVPEDVSVCGFDNAPIGEFLDPPLSSIEQPADEMGSFAAEMLLRHLSDKAWEIPLLSVLPSQHIPRGSTTATQCIQQ